MPELFSKILIKISPLSLGLTKHTSCRIAYISQGSTKMSSNLHVLGAAFSSQRLVLSVPHHMSNVTNVRCQRVKVRKFTNVKFFSKFVVLGN